MEAAGQKRAASTCIGEMMELPRHYTDEGDGIPVVFFNAFPLNARMWKQQRSGIEGCRIISFDQPGFGLGGVLEGPRSIDDCADLGLRLADHLQLEQFVAAGCSMGGYIVMSLMRRAADRLSGVVLANTRQGADTEEGRLNRLAQAALVRTGGSETFVADMLPKLLSPEAGSKRPALVEELRAIMAEASVEGISLMLEAMATRPDSSATLASWQKPACVITGDDDRLIPMLEAEAMASMLPDARLHVLAGSGHLCNFEHPQAFNRIVEDFVKNLTIGN